MKRKAKKTTLWTKYVYKHTHTQKTQAHGMLHACCVYVSVHICAFTIVFTASPCSSFGIREKKRSQMRTFSFSFSVFLLPFIVAVPPFQLHGEAMQNGK